MAVRQVPNILRNAYEGFTWRVFIAPARHIRLASWEMTARPAEGTIRLQRTQLNRLLRAAPWRPYFEGPLCYSRKSRRPVSWTARRIAGA